MLKYHICVDGFLNWHLFAYNCIEHSLNFLLCILWVEVVPAAHSTGMLLGSLVALAVGPLLEITKEIYNDWIMFPDLVALVGTTHQCKFWFIIEDFQLSGRHPTCKLAYVWFFGVLWTECLFITLKPWKQVLLSSKSVGGGVSRTSSHILFSPGTVHSPDSRIILESSFWSQSHVYPE